MAQQPTNIVETLMADINHAPKVVSPKPNYFSTVGDMHGNTMKLIWVLLYLGIIRLPHHQEQYEQLWELYHTPYKAQSFTLFEAFLDILKTASFHPEHTKGLILIGDLLADRGQNDLFTIKVFEQLKTHQVPCEILLSNHDVNTIMLAERPKNATQIIALSPEFNRSLCSFTLLFQDNSSLCDPIFECMDASYTAHVLALKLVCHQNINFLFSHAVFDIVIYANIMKILEIPFKMHSLESFKTSIDRLNTILHQMLSEHKYNLLRPLFHNFIWNRNLSSPTQSFLKTHNLHLIHGHVGESEDHRSIRVIKEQLDSEYNTNLDNNLGRPVMAPIQNVGKLKLFHHLPAEEEKAEISHSI